jgi:hypothetical protein
MELLKQPPTGKGPAEWFTGDVWFDVIYRGEEPSRARENMVKFAPRRPHGLALPRPRPDAVHRRGNSFDPVQAR